LTSIKPGLAGEKSPFKRKEKQKRKEKKDTQKSETKAQTNRKVFFRFFTSAVTSCVRNIFIVDSLKANYPELVNRVTRRGEFSPIGHFWVVV
jgi:hypothetical protein